MFESIKPFHFIFFFFTLSLSFCPFLVKLTFMEPEFFPGGHSIRTKGGLMNYLLKYRIVESPRVLSVMEKIDRALFVRKGTPPYTDCHQLIGYGASIYAPNQVAQCLEVMLSRLNPGMRALDIGSGSGYLTACFALMVGRNGRAVGVEKVPELVDFSVLNIKKCKKAAALLRHGSLSLHVGDGRNGWAELGPYDAISVGFVVTEIYPALTEQLKPGGRMMIPVREGESVNLTLVDKKSDGSIDVLLKHPVHGVNSRGSAIFVAPL